MQPIWAVGLMTGTVLDGNIDVALLKTDGERIERFGAYTLAPYPQSIRKVLEETLAEARRWNFDGPEPAIFAQAEEMLTRAQSVAVKELVECAGLTMADIGVVGFHGQSVLHRAPQPGRIGATRQLGNGALMHELLGVKVAYDFRSADVRAGGQGAPLAAVYHQALLRGLGTHGEVAVLNLGGVANVTYWDGGETLIAFDTGPANAPLNDFMKEHGLGDMDRDGALARSGTVDEARLAELLQHPYLAAPPPKSTGKEMFHAGYLDAALAALDEPVAVDDVFATLTELTARTVADACDRHGVTEVVAAGGGVRNPTLRSRLAALGRGRWRTRPGPGGTS